jgi:uncharacterized membrane protein YdbT with pleckstrin-like domain
MPYPRRLIQEGETVALDLKPHWWFFAKHIVTGAILFFIMIMLWFWAGGTVEKVTWWLWGVVALAWAVWLGIKFLVWQFTYFVVTDNRVIYRTGVLAKRGVEIPLERVNNINFSQGIIDRLVGAGSLEIESAGTDGQSRFTDVRHPDGVQQEIYRQMEAHGRKRAGWHQEAAAAAAAAAPAPAMAAPAPAPAPGPGIPEQLNQLAELRDKGVITAAEFEAKKAQLLERM